MVWFNMMTRLSSLTLNLQHKILTMDLLLILKLALGLAFAMVVKVSSHIVRASLVPGSKDNARYVHDRDT